MIPHLCVADGNAAMDFYIKAFGATGPDARPRKDGKKLMHGELLINGSLLYCTTTIPKCPAARVPRPSR